VATRRHLAWLAIILAVGLALRLAYFVHARQTPGYAWEDPDGYMTQALKLAGHGTGWRWTFDAVTYDIEGRRHALPPGYSIFLSLFAVFPGFPLTAQIAQILLALVTITLVFELGRLVHSPASGLVAAAGYAVWIPNIFNVWSTSQETVYLPLILLGFVLFGRALTRDAAPTRFVLVGVVFGAAALTRSMPLFFAVPAALIHVWLAPDRPRAGRQAAGFLAGFLLLTVPYSVGLSRHFGHLAVIDTHGSIHQEVAPGQQAPGLIETAAALGRQVIARPLGFAGECLERARSLLYVNGGRILQIYVVSETRLAAAAWKALVHVGADALLVIAVLLAPIGAALCRQRRLAAQLLLWAAVNIAIASLGGFGGARLRAPFEPLLILLASVVLTGGWQRPRGAWLAAALTAAAVGGLAVVPQIPRSLRSWPDYGVEWPSIFARASGRVHGSAGFNVPAASGFAEFSVTVPGSAHDGEPGVKVSVGGRGVWLHTVQVAPGHTHRFRTIWPQPGLAFLEVAAERADDGSAAGVIVTVPR
jgi:hypothetical protein